MNDFFETNSDKLKEYINMSNAAGSRSDYVQGGGGNTSVKLDDNLMAIKASGFCLDQISVDDAYAVLNYAAIREFYYNTDPGTLDDIEKAGSAKAKESIQNIPGLPKLRPSVEAGFHSLLDTFVLHTHPVYANLAACSAEGAEVVQEALADMGHSHAYVPYINPGAQLTFSIMNITNEVEKNTGKKPAIIFMENHGLIVTCPTGAECLKLSDEVNKRIARAYGVTFDDWPEIMLETGPGEGTWISVTAWLKNQLLTRDWNLDFFTKQSLYPDQLVFLNGQVDVVERGNLTSALISGNKISNKCTFFRETGEVYYTCERKEAQTIEETLCAILFITETIIKSGRHICTMDEAGKDFISGWESEAYRRNLAAVR